MKRRLIPAVQRYSILSLAVAAIIAVNAPGATVTWNFDSDPANQIPPGFAAVVGTWNVVPEPAAPSEPNVLRGTGKSTYNLSLVSASSYKDLDLSVKVQAISGKIDQGGGLIWRVVDQNNYYVARFNPISTSLNSALHVRAFVNGSRKTMKDVALPNSRDKNWHTMRLTMSGNHIILYFDGIKQIDFYDSTYTKAGKIGLWLKEDAVSNFDDFTVTDLSGVSILQPPLQTGLKISQGNNLNCHFDLLGRQKYLDQNGIQKLSAGMYFRSISESATGKQPVYRMTDR